MNKINPQKVNVGDVMAFVNFVKVTETQNNGEVLVVKGLDDSDKAIRVAGTDLIEHSLSADQFVEEKKVSRTDLIKVLITSYNRPLTVCFIKKNDEERVLRGRFIRHEEFYGRSIVEDLDAAGTPAQRIREADHRTLQWLIVDNVKYIVK